MTDRIDIGLTHVALPVSAIEVSIKFYADYAGMQVIHQREDSDSGIKVAWLSDLTRPFVIVLIEGGTVDGALRPIGHLGVAVPSRAEVDRICELARRESRHVQGPQDSGYPVGYWAFIEDPDGHTLEMSYGQEIGFTIEAFDRGSRNRA